MKLYLVSLLCLFCLPVMATEVYISRDANGNIIYSDQPSQNAEKLKVRELPSVPALAPPPSAQQPARVNGPVFSYTSLSIITPQNGHQLAMGYTGNIEVSGVLSPGLRESDTLLLLDNGTVIATGRQSFFQLTNLDRGEHQLQMVVRNKEGITMISSNPVTLYVQRASVLNRAK